MTKKDDGWKLDTSYRLAEDMACLYGIPKETGCFKLKVQVELEDGTGDTRTVEILIVDPDVTVSEEEITLRFIADQTALFHDGHAGEIYDVELLSGELPPCMTFFRDGGQLRYCGEPSQPGIYTATFRILLTTGKAIEHTVRVIVTAQYRESSESILLRKDTEAQSFLTFKGADQVYRMEKIDGSLPADIAWHCSMSEAPYISGSSSSTGSRRIVFRILLCDGNLRDTYGGSDHLLRRTVHGGIRPGPV